MILNENNIQAPFQYKISENTFELLERSGEIELNTNNVQVKVFQGQRLFCADIGYAVDGLLENMEFLIDDIKVYPVLLQELEDLQKTDIKENEIYLIKDDINFKSIIFFPTADLNKNFKYKITTYSSTFSAFMFDEIANKLNSIDTNYPVKNYYENIDYKVNDIIKYKGYLYRVFKEFTSDRTDYYLRTNCNLITPFRKLELNTEYKTNELIEYNNNFLIAQKDFLYESKDGALTNLNGLLKPLQDIIFWFDGISKIYKNQIIIKDNISYIVLENIENPVWSRIQRNIDYLNKAENTFYDDSNSSFGKNTNTVQKAIEKLKINKQDSLIAGNNIILNGNTISVNGGTNKEYIVSDVYFVNDLIVRDSKIYKVNENFIASDWNTDRAKLTLISSDRGVAAEAIDVSFDNSKANLEYISGYDFPKFKNSIDDTMNLLLSGGIPATITKDDDGSYKLNVDLKNYSNITNDFIAIVIESIDNNSSIFYIFSILSQFFEFSKSDNHIFYTCEEGEITVEGINEELEFNFKFVEGLGVILNIGRIDNVPIPSGSYNITLNIKNRVLRNNDTNIFCLDYKASSLYNLTLINNNDTVKLTGNFTALGSGIDGLYFYNTIMENYFNLVEDLKNLKATDGIISSSGKAVKFGVNKIVGIETTIYRFLVAHQDDSPVEAGEIFTLNLIPDKNSKLDPIYSEVNNVQQMGEVLALRYNIPLFYFVFPEDDGTFDDKKRPTNYYQKVFGITTVWKKRFATTGAFLRFEGGFADEARNGLIQNYADKRLVGTFYGVQTTFGDYGNTGVFYTTYREGNSISAKSNDGSLPPLSFIGFDNSRMASASDNESRPTNIKIELYELVSINGVNIWN
ncbi:phage tail protein [Brachyspira sp.]|uniref:phage tail protein n=1 Tax=Brachyspira sp. TaxID=1977261 RepID=UPI002625A41C|nr:phage tail protein [Brachyspira sp.]